VIGVVLSVVLATSGGSLEAEGIGKPPAGKSGAQARLMARRAAEVIAVRNLGRAQAGVDTERRSGRIRWSGVVRGYRIKSEQARPDGTHKIVVTSRGTPSPISPARGRRNQRQPDDP
jgi:hypothetical protein